jgi:hypothetical protein
MYVFVSQAANWLLTALCTFGRSGNSYSRGLQAMYACIHETGRGFFSGVCR